MKKMTRRKFIRQTSISILAAAGTIHFNPFEVFAGHPETELAWDKAPCRFCGTGCSVLVGVKDGKIVAVQGDSRSSVNQGTLCVKGYSLPFIQSGKDRLTRPLVRMKNGHYDKHGELTETSWDEAMDLIVRKAKQSIREKGPESVALSRAS